MKKVIIYFLLFSLAATNAFAQKDAAAKAILNQVSQKYRSYNVVKSDFTFYIDDQQSNMQQTQNGTLVVQGKTNKYKLTLYSPDATAVPQVDQEIISDGKSQWTYIKKDKEVQLANVEHNDESFNPAQLFTMYEKGYKYIFINTISIKGRLYQVIDLSPEDIDKSFFKIRLTIDKVKKQIYSALIFDKSGGRYTYTIRTFTPNVKVPDNIFTYNSKSHPGVEVVDLRQ